MKKLFGANITPSCAYCANASSEQGIVFCSKNRQLENNKCRKFRYDPLLRVPAHTTIKRTYDENDFKL